MKCLFCGSELLRKTKENVPLVGLPSITLVGVVVEGCLNCGESEVEIPHHSRLIEVVATGLINKRDRLVGVEIRWLRSFLGMSGMELARHVGVSPESVSKWENEHTHPSRSADLMLRSLVARRFPKEVFPEQAFSVVSGKGRKPLCMRLKSDGKHWFLESASPLDGLVSDPTVSRWSVLEAVR